MLWNSITCLNAEPTFVAAELSLYRCPKAAAARWYC
ncbi:hypothetical protein X975_19164, partial [Stegodyphus mimosarum]